MPRYCVPDCDDIEPQYILVSGPTGPRGKDGLDGCRGRTGETGPTGPSGGPTGPTGPRGHTGPDGGKIFAGGVPSGVAPPGGNLHFNTSTGDVYYSTSGLWTLAGNVRGPTGEIGHTGPTGASGVTGPTGPSGATGPTGPSGASGVTGPAGMTGPVGPTGPIGSYVFTGVTPPVGIPPNEVRSIYFDVKTGDVYYFTEGGWTLVGNILGPTGPSGPTGPIGVTGPVGQNGKKGHSDPCNTVICTIPCNDRCPPRCDPGPKCVQVSPTCKCDSPAKSKCSCHKKKTSGLVTWSLNQDFSSSGPSTCTLGELQLEVSCGTLVITSSYQGTLYKGIESNQGEADFTLGLSVRDQCGHVVLSRNFPVREPLQAETTAYWSRTYVTHVPIQEESCYTICARISVASGNEVSIRACSDPCAYFNLTINQS